MQSGAVQEIISRAKRLRPEALEAVNAVASAKESLQLTELNFTFDVTQLYSLQFTVLNFKTSCTTSLSKL